MTRPKFFIVGGPNGSGKSSQSKPFLDEGLLFLNPDEIARVISAKSETERAIEAGRVVLKYVQDLIAQKRSFALESTLSGSAQLQMIKRAQAAGFMTHLVYVTTDDPAINIDRVAARVARGGHNIPVDDIVRRWHRSIEGLHRYLRLVDTATLIDNSGAKAFVVAELVQGKVSVVAPTLPPWAISVINHLL
jgi:predicted ABC-type ATPase